MNIRLFNKWYWIRRFGEQREIRGYLGSGYEDFAASLHIHPTGTDTVQGNPEGERRIKRLEGHGEIELRIGNPDTGCKGDLLFYHGDWYECRSAQMWDHTLLNHWNYQFVMVPRDASYSIDIEKDPIGVPGSKDGGEN